jgi:hypothetical protein
VSAATPLDVLKNNSFKNSALTHQAGLARLLLCPQRGKSPAASSNFFQETIMNTRISTKLTALAIALMMNGFIIGGVAYLFDAQTQQHLSVISFAKQLAAFQWLI